ncbi:3-deoxy-7-phosphoheptulonate synthase [Flavobacteriaceae bacterium]|nr:3-deoxy-7-phosphoheptulonate synthase [Flavobacteriaceae bacterium]
MNSTWKKNSWKKFKTKQQPKWPNLDLFNETLEKLNNLPSLVFSGETRMLKSDLSRVNIGEKFILQVGNCSETFSDCNGPKIHNFLRLMLQMESIIEFNTNIEIIKIGRIAGQYAKPRTANSELINGIKVSTYRGDNINDYNSDIDSRTPNPLRLLEGYFRSASTLNLIRAFIQGQYNDIAYFNNWEEHYFHKEILKNKKYLKFANEFNTILERKTNKSKKQYKNDSVYISHEALLLDYEESFVREDTTFSGFYSTSAHTLWIGNRTRQLHGGHVEFVRGIDNPIGVKIGPDYVIDEILQIINKINPLNEPGRVMLISRMGAEQINLKLKPLMETIKKSHNNNVIWICDPMHGNTFSHKNYKVRRFENITEEIKAFFAICNSLGLVPGGVHLELTEENVTECIGGISNIELSDLNVNYTTKVDPRLNALQGLEIAFLISSLISKQEIN